MIQWSISRRSGLALLGFALCLVAFVGLTAQPALAASKYVSKFGSDVPTNGSAGNPYLTVGYAISRSTAGSGDDIHVGIGTFEENISMKDGVSVYGAGALATTLDGTGAGTVVTATSISAGTTISGLKITGGDTAASGGGINCTGSSLTIANNIITENSAATGGGGIFCDSASTPTIVDNTITLNTVVDGGGAGISCADSSPTITENMIADNTASGGGGGGIDCSSATITLNLVTRNKALHGPGGGINWSGASPTVTQNDIIGNEAFTTGGGISCDGFSSSTITSNTITGNKGTGASANGGGIYCGRNSSPTIAHNTIGANVSVNGGGILCDALSASTITSNTISDNSASTGGGVFCYISSSTITNNTITGNEALTYAGGGINCSNCSPTITGNTIVANTAVNYGGGGINCFNSSPSIERNIISENTASNVGGGGILCNVSSPSVINNVITGNTATGLAGGGIFCGRNSSPTVTNNTITGNTGGFGGGVYAQDSSAVPAISNCIIWANGDDLSGCSATYSDVQTADDASGLGNISALPDFVAAAADFKTGDFHLLVSSPCIDVATSTAAPATDKDDVARPVGLGFDMGAYEYPVPPDMVRAFIDSVTPSSITSGQAVAFVGHGTDPDHAITGYDWTSSLDGSLSSAATFSKSTLSVGTHTITFKVQCSNGVWSPEVSTTVVVGPAPPPNYRPVYRFYNSRQGVHFYTADQAERQNVIDNLSAIYHDEGVAYTINTSNPANGQPLHRFFNMQMGVHFYTASETEKQYVIDNLSATYRYEGVAYNVSASPVAGATTVWRFFNKKTGTHFYTASEDEKNSTIALLGATYKFEGAGFYLAP